MFLDSNGVTEIFGKDFGNIIAASSFARKMFLMNNLGRVSGQISIDAGAFPDDDFYSRLRFGLCPDTVSCPYNVEATAIAGGSLAADTTYYYRITAFNENGETGPSLEVSAVTTSANKAITLSWDKPAGAWGYIIYRSTNQNYANGRRDVIENSDTLTWTDSGQVADPSSPYGWPGVNTDFDIPEANTTAGEAPDYGTAPALNEGPLSLGVLQIGQQIAFWVGVVSTVATPEGLGNATLQVTEA